MRTLLLPLFAALLIASCGKKEEEKPIYTDGGVTIKKELVMDVPNYAPLERISFDAQPRNLGGEDNGTLFRFKKPVKISEIRQGELPKEIPERFPNKWKQGVFFFDGVDFSTEPPARSKGTRGHCGILSSSEKSFLLEGDYFFKGTLGLTAIGTDPVYDALQNRGAAAPRILGYKSFLYIWELVPSTKNQKNDFLFYCSLETNRTLNDIEYSVSSSNLHFVWNMPFQSNRTVRLLWRYAINTYIN